MEWESIACMHVRCTAWSCVVQIRFASGIGWVKRVGRLSFTRSVLWLSRPGVTILPTEHELRRCLAKEYEILCDQNFQKDGLAQPRVELGTFALLYGRSHTKPREGDV